MLKDDIAESLGQSWDFASAAAQEEFAEAMKCRQYGWDALHSAWAWFLVGWTAAGGETTGDRRQ